MTTAKLSAYSFLLGSPFLNTFGSCGKLNPTILAVWAIVLSPLAWNSCWTAYQALWEPARGNIICHTFCQFLTQVCEVGLCHEGHLLLVLAVLLLGDHILLVHGQDVAHGL